jgi:hypothetical protein
MNRIKLTAGRIRDFTTEAGQAFLWDTEAPGLAVRATARGARAFIFQAKLNGKAIRVTIGDVGTWGIDAARAEARRLGSLIDRDMDPRQEKEERRATIEAEKEAKRRRDVLMGEAWSAYLEERRSKWSVVHLKNHLNMSKAGGEPRTRGRRKGEAAVTLPGPLYPLLSGWRKSTPRPLRHGWHPWQPAPPPKPRKHSAPFAPSWAGAPNTRNTGPSPMPTPANPRG